jgi:hypothetical protein
MALQRHDGTGWAAARAAYTLFEKNVYPEGPPIWLRARMIWRVTDGAWQPTSAGYGVVSDLSVSAGTLARTEDGGPAIENPVTGEQNYYWESFVTVAAGANCYGYALWFYDINGEQQMWTFLGSFSCTPGASGRRHWVENGSYGRNGVRWCVTAFDAGSSDEGALPAGQQGFSRFAFG